MGVISPFGRRLRPRSLRGLPVWASSGCATHRHLEPTLIKRSHLITTAKQQQQPQQTPQHTSQSPTKPAIITSIAPPSPPASPPVSPASASSPTFQSANLLRRLSRRLSHTRADLSRRVSTGASPEARTKRLSASPSPMGGLRGEGRPRLDPAVEQSINASHLASPPPSAPASPSPQPGPAAVLLTRSMSLSTVSHSPSPAAGRLERSRSESVRGSLASGLTSGQLTPPENAWDRDWETIAKGRNNGRGRGEGGLWWDAEMGICWDGNEIRELPPGGLASPLNLSDRFRRANTCCLFSQSNQTCTPSPAPTTPTLTSSTPLEPLSAPPPPPRPAPPPSRATRPSLSSPLACPPSRPARHSRPRTHTCLRRPPRRWPRRRSCLDWG